MHFSVLGLLHFTWYPSAHAWWQDFSFVTAVPLCIPPTFSLHIPPSMDNSCIPYLTYFFTITMEIKTPQETNLYSLGSMSNGNITLPYSAWCYIEPQHPKLGAKQKLPSSLEVLTLGPKPQAFCDRNRKWTITGTYTGWSQVYYINLYTGESR